MARVRFEGFEEGTATPDLTNGHYSDVSGTVSIDGTIKRSGDYALRSNPTTTAVGYVQLGPIDNATGSPRPTFGWDLEKVWCRFYFYVATLPSSNEEPICAIVSAVGTAKVSVRITSTGLLKLFGSTGSQIGSTGSTALSTGVWYKIDVFCGTDASAGPAMVRINDVVEIVGVGNTNAANSGHMKLGKYTNVNGRTVDFYYDDFAADDAYFPEAGAVVRLDTNGAGGTHEWTAGTNSSDWQEVDETPEDNDTTYVEATADTDLSLFTCESFSSAGVTIANKRITAVRVATAVRRNGVTDATGATVMKSSSTSVQNPTGWTAPNTSTYNQREYFAKLDPHDNTRWTQSRVEALEFGVIATSAQTSPERCTRACVYVDYEDVPVSKRGFRVHQGIIQNPTAIGVQNITGVGFRPKAILVYGFGNQTPGRQDDFKLMYGVAVDRGRQWSWGDFRDDAQGTSSVRPSLDKQGFIRHPLLSSDRFRAHAFNFNSDGFDILWEKADSVIRQIFYVAIGGDSLTDVEATYLDTITTTGSQSVTDIGFQPDFLFAAAGAASGTCHSSFMASRGASDRWSSHTFETNGAGTMVTKSIQKVDKFLLRWGNGSLELEGDLTSFDTGGFTYNISGNSGSAFGVAYLAMKGLTSKLGTFDQPTSNGTQAITGVGFKPKFALFQSHGFANHGTQQSGGQKALGVATATSNVNSVSAVSADGTGSSQEDTDTANDKCIILQAVGATASRVAAAEMDSLDSDGFTLDWTSTDATARKILYAALFGAQTGAVSTDSITSITSSTASSGGEVTDDGSETITARGVCWNTTGSPTISDSHTTDGSGLGTFTSSLTGLASATTYKVRAYATNSQGTAYGDEETFATDPAAGAGRGDLFLLGVGA